MWIHWSKSSRGHQDVEVGRTQDRRREAKSTGSAQKRRLEGWYCCLQLPNRGVIGMTDECNPRKFRVKLPEEQSWRRCNISHYPQICAPLLLPLTNCQSALYRFYSYTSGCSLPQCKLFLFKQCSHQPEDGKLSSAWLMKLTAGVTMYF